MVNIYFDKPSVHRAEQLRFVRVEFGGVVWYQFEADGEKIASIVCDELPPITVVRSSPIEEESRPLQTGSAT